MQSFDTGQDAAACGKLVSLMKEMLHNCHENEVIFRNNSDIDSAGIASTFSEIKVQINECIPVIKQLYNVAHKYDACPEIKANGIRSWLSSMERLCAMLLSLGKYAEYKHNSLFFRRSSFAYKLRVHADYLNAVRQCLEVTLRLTTVGNGSSVIADCNLDPSVCVDDVVDLMSEMRQIDVLAFCGRTQCFHFCDSAQPVAQGILLAFATFSAAYGPVSPESPLQNAVQHISEAESVGGKNGNKKHKSSGAGFLSLLSNPDVLSQQVLWALANFDLEFVKKFWQLGDNHLILSSANLVLPSILTSEGINLHTVPLRVTTLHGKEFTLEPPSMFSGIKPIKGLLLSNTHRKGQEYWTRQSHKGQVKPPSDTIVFQVHGGGFICQSAKAQEVYLRKLCRETDVPFFCVDYSLLPDDPFPRATEEGKLLPTHTQTHKLSHSFIHSSIY